MGVNVVCSLRRALAQLAPRCNTRRAPLAAAAAAAVNVRRQALARGTATLRAHDGTPPFALHPLRAAQVAAFLFLASNLCPAYGDGAPPLAHNPVLAAQVAVRITPPCLHLRCINFTLGRRQCRGREHVF